MERSPELVSHLQDLYDAVCTGDGDTIEGLMTARDGLVFIGSDPKEWFGDRKQARALLEEQSELGVKVEGGDAIAYEEGTVGWIADRGNFVLPDGAKVPFRITAVLHREDGAWKMVQEHCSVAVSNEEAVGEDF